MNETSGTLQVTSSGEREIVLTRRYPAPRERLFAAYTRSELIRRWLGPPSSSMVVCENDPRVGGQYRYVWRKTDGTEMGMRGEYREVVPPQRLALTERFDDDPTGAESLATVTLDEENGRTTVTTTMRYASRAVREAVLQSWMAKVAAMSYDRLEALLAEEER